MVSERAPADDELDTAELALGDASGIVPSGSSERALLLSGQLDAQGYLDALVARALAPYEAVLDAERIATMREVLLEQFAQDPGLSALLARATSADRTNVEVGS